MDYKDKFEDIDILKDGLSDQKKLEENMSTITENKELTFGQKAVGLNFNHAEGILNQRVHKAKQLSADLIDLVNEVYEENVNHSWISNVFRTTAFNTIIAAQMQVVKFLTWKD